MGREKRSYLEQGIRIISLVLFIGSLFLRTYNYYFLATASIIFLIIILFGKKLFGSEYNFHLLMNIALIIWIFSQNPLIYNTYIYWIGMVISIIIMILSFSKYGTKEMHEKFASQRNLVYNFTLISSIILLIALIVISLITKQASFFLLGLILFILSLVLYLRKK